MLEFILIITIIFLILTFFYKQAICDFRINQIEWKTQRDNISTLLGEKVPFIIRSIPNSNFWTHEDVMNRECFKDIPIFHELTLVDWISKTTPDSICPWTYTQAETIASVTGINIWATKWLHSSIINPILKLWMFPKYHCWAGNIGLRKLFATWTCILPVDGEIILSLMPENNESYLPANWLGVYPANITIKDTPFAGDLKFIDIILRPGNCIFIPAHWFVSWITNAESSVTPMVCTISYHTPISYFAFNVAPLR